MDIPALICSYDWPCSEALGVVYGNARCPWGESSGDPSAIYGANYGLFQVNAVHSWRVGGDVGALLDPEVNVMIAYQIWSEQGWAPWSCRP